MCEPQSSYSQLKKPRVAPEVMWNILVAFFGWVLYVGTRVASHFINGVPEAPLES